ncbi:hypothetical protein [Xanthomonas sp. 3075]|uniref:hypothetical protein n=1 Tax=Xanthomonas sp. 3075 TaxID=3035315 RepID=UPI0016201FF2|nr:hypothetical protein [Xanthomonas sp. 3075]MBB4133428.1 hypothetical protein [Xanthomonas sp. 3075]
MQDTISPSAKLEAALSDTSEVYVNAGTDASAYYARLADNIRQNQCEPFTVTAVVKEPGFPDASVGSTIYGECVAHANGYWLVYQSEQDRFCCFWGLESSNLGAHGVFGSPLYCWSA